MSSAMIAKSHCSSFQPSYCDAIVVRGMSVIDAFQQSACRALAQYDDSDIDSTAAQPFALKGAN
jgi:hypothetical protein